MLPILSNDSVFGICEGTILPFDASKFTPHYPTISTLYASAPSTSTSIIKLSSVHVDLLMMQTIVCSVLVVGSGNAGFSAALSAAQSHAGKVLLIDKCPENWAGGNSYFTAGAFRISHDGLSDLLPIVTNVDTETAKAIDLEPYTEDDFLGDMDRITLSRYDRELGRTLVGESNRAVKWLAGLGLGFQLSFNRQVNFLKHC